MTVRLQPCVGKRCAGSLTGGKPNRKGRRPKPTPSQITPYEKITNCQPYIFFSEHTFLAASQAPPAFSQSAAFFAVVTSPANAGRDPTPLTLWIWKSSTWSTKSLGSRSQRANHPAIRRRTKSGGPRYASVSSPSLATAGWISTLFSTECLRAYRSRLGRRRLTETTFSRQRLIQRKPLQAHHGGLKRRGIDYRSVLLSHLRAGKFITLRQKARVIKKSR